MPEAAEGGEDYLVIDEQELDVSLMEAEAAQILAQRMMREVAQILKAHSQLFEEDMVFGFLVEELREVVRVEKLCSLADIKGLHHGLKDCIGRAAEVAMFDTDEDRRPLKEGLRVFADSNDADNLLREIVSKREEEAIINARESAAKMIVMGEISEDQIVLGHIMSVRVQVWRLIKGYNEVAGIVAVDDEEGFPLVDGEEIVAEIGVNKFFELCQLSEAKLEKIEGHPFDGVARVILHTRRSIIGDRESVNRLSEVVPVLTQGALHALTDEN